MIAIRSSASGELLFVTSLDGYDPAEWQPEGEPIEDVADAGLVERLECVDGEWRESSAAVADLLIDQVKAERERLAGELYTGTPAKLAAYAAKAAEVAAWREDEELTAEDAVERFPFASADATAFVDTLADAITRFAAGMSNSTSRAAELEATEQSTIARIRASGTPAEQREIVAGISWG